MQEHPEIADFYRDGQTFRIIASRVIPDEMTISISVACLGVERAIKELIPDEEREPLAYEHQITGATRQAYKTEEEKRVGKSKGGRVLKEKKAGIFGY